MTERPDPNTLSSSLATLPDGGEPIDPARAVAEPILQFFDYRHLPPPLSEVSRPFCALAVAIIDTLPRNAERSVALRKLLEAKDAAVRAAIAKR